MKSTKYLLVGGGLAANSAAKALRKSDTDAGIVVVTDEPHLPYNRPPLSKDYLKGKLVRERLFFDPKSFYEENRIEVVLNNSVKKINLEEKIAHLSNDELIRFDKALVATGGCPIRLRITGSDLGGVTYLRTLDDAEVIIRLAKKGQRVVIIGGGFIGLELAASLTSLGMRCDVVELQPRIWSRFAPEQLSFFFQDYCIAKGVRFHFEDKVIGILGKNRKVSRVCLESKRELDCDMVCIGVGIVPNTELATASGLTTENGIVVNAFLRTSHPDIFAAGDVANYIDSVSGKRKRVEHWGHAKFSGQCAAQNMMGNAQKYEFLSYVWSDIFDCRLNFAGDESGYDELVIRGDVDQGSFTLLCLRDHRLTGGFTVNVKGIEFAMVKRLIQERLDLSGKMDKLRDVEFRLKELL